MVAEYSDIDFDTACNRLQTIAQAFMTKADELACAVGNRATSFSEQADLKPPIKPLTTQWERDAALAYQKLLTNAARDLDKVMKESKLATELKEGLDIVCDKLEYEVANLERIYNPISTPQGRLFQRSKIEAIPCGFPIRTSTISQIRKDSWDKDVDGIAYSRHEAKGNPQNYVEHYISTPGDITMLPWSAAEQIIDKLGFNSVKLQFLFAAHALKQPKPWESSFTLKGSDIIKELGWDKRTDIKVGDRLKEIANNAFVLDALVMKCVWDEGPHKKGGVQISLDTSRMWNVAIKVTGQGNLLDGRLDHPDEVYITVQPGAWSRMFVNKAGAKASEALYQFGYIAQEVLRIDPYHNELALRIAIYLTTESKIHKGGRYKVRTLLEAAITIAEINSARSNFRKGYELKQRWDNAFKLLKTLNWQIEYDEKFYPEYLRPGSTIRKPKGYFDKLLEATLTVTPPSPIPELLRGGFEINTSPLKLKPANGQFLTNDQICKARKAKGWTQRKLGEFLGVSQSTVNLWEKGHRTPDPKAEAKLRRLLDIE